jgi:uncharacterized phage-associated protein
VETTASKVAKYVIAEFHESEDLITNMKVQKLLYYIQGWHLGLYGTPVFADDFEAWVHGPVQYEVYNEYKNYKWNPIIKPVVKPVLEQSLVSHISQVLECYGGETAYSLELMTHKEWPWIEARDDLAPTEPSGNIIFTETMKKYFADLARKNEENHNYMLNNETVKLLEESKRGIGINRYSSWEEMIEKVKNN